MSKLTCTMPECERKHLAKGMCKMHYYRVNRKPEPIRYIPSTCTECGVDYQGSRGAWTTLCPPCARRIAGLKRRTETPKVRKPKQAIKCKVSFINCKECANVFASRTKARIYCSTPCLYAGNLKDKRDDYAANLSKACRDCGVDITSLPWSRLCPKCRRVIDTEAHRAGQQRRRARLRGVEHESIIARQIYEHDDWTCGICGLPVDQALTYPHKMSASLDHVIPIARGGTHTKGNVQCSHLVCNVLKGDKMPTPQNAMHPWVSAISGPPSRERLHRVVTNTHRAQGVPDGSFGRSGEASL